MSPTHTRGDFLSTCITSTPIPTDDPSCPICKDVYNTTDHIAVTFSDEACCKHVYGKSCLLQWLETDGVNTCALCRRELFCLPTVGVSGYHTFEIEYESWDEDDDDDDDDEYNSLYCPTEESDEEDEDEEDLTAREWSDEDVFFLLDDIWGKIWCQHVGCSSSSLPTANQLTHTFLGCLVDCESGNEIIGGLDGDRLMDLDEFLMEMMDVQRLEVVEGKQGWKEKLERVLGIVTSDEGEEVVEPLLEFESC